MNPNGAAEKGKRKMNAGGPSSGHEVHHFASPRLPSDGRFSQVQQMLNAAANKPFSYMSLLTAPYEDEEEEHAQIDQIISLHSENLKQALGGAMAQQEERAAKRLKERESELLTQNARLQSVADYHRAQAEKLMIKVRSLERTTWSLSQRLDQQETQDEAESSFPDPDRVAPITLECRICQRKRATVMLWPCRHICLCKRCDAAATFCPVCCTTKNNSIEVRHPQF